jgi:[ribosomal protein S5]-alanine N-acetyltransferase
LPEHAEFLATQLEVEGLHRIDLAARSAAGARLSGRLFTRRRSHDGTRHRGWLRCWHDHAKRSRPEATMLNGQSITLRPVRESDLKTLYDFHIDIANRGDYFPHGIASEVTFGRRFHENGMWAKEEGTLAIVDAEDTIIGHIEFFRTVAYLAEYELSYIVYRPEHRGHGVTTEAVRLMTEYLFATKPINRIRLVIDPDNAASRRIAEKCGYRHEGTSRGAWYNRGRYQDVEIYAILHSEALRMAAS